MAVLTTGNITVPNQIFDPWLGKVSNGSTISALSGALPMKFGTGQTMTFDIGEASHPSNCWCVPSAAITVRLTDGP